MAGAIGRFRQLAWTARTLARAGLIRFERPDFPVRRAVLMSRWGATPAAGFAYGAKRYPGEIALIDEAGSLTFAEINRRTNALAASLSERGVAPGTTAAVMCRNHRGFVEAITALSKLGAHAVLLNTAFAAAQVLEVIEREQARVLIFDGEFAVALADGCRDRLALVGWPGDDAANDGQSLEELIRHGDPSPRRAPAEPGTVVILTSGTTGTPKGASRPLPESPTESIATLLGAIPLRVRERALLAAPLFHSWAFGHLSFGLALSSTFVLPRRFDPEQTLALIERHRCRTLVVVPVMIQRILELPEEVRHRYDTSSLEVVALSGSALPGELALRFMDEFGDVVYNFYGSTEVAWAAIAGPQDLRAAPGTAGRAPRGTTLRILDERGRELPAGESGRIFVANDLLFEGYRDGGGKEVIRGLMSTGDVGRLDERGRLFVEGRDDEMIVSGGENVFPREVEDLLCAHPRIVEAAAVGVSDQEFGQRLKAFVVVRHGELSGDDVRLYVKENLARFKVPRDVVFVDTLPRNATGKVLKRELR